MENGPNIYGDNRNLEAIDFIKEMNTIVYREFPDIQTIAEDSSDFFPEVTKPIYDGRSSWLWDEMDDGLDARYTKVFQRRSYCQKKYHHHKLTFSTMYMLNENFMLPLSHDEVVMVKSSLILKCGVMNGKNNLRAMYMYIHVRTSGNKLLFYGRRIRASSRMEF